MTKKELPGFEYRGRRMKWAFLGGGALAWAFFAVLNIFDIAPVDRPGIVEIILLPMAVLLFFFVGFVLGSSLFEKRFTCTDCDD